MAAWLQGRGRDRMLAQEPEGVRGRVDPRPLTLLLTKTRRGDPCPLLLAPPQLCLSWEISEPQGEGWRAQKGGAGRKRRGNPVSSQACGGQLGPGTALCPRGDIWGLLMGGRQVQGSKLDPPRLPGLRHLSQGKGNGIMADYSWCLKTTHTHTSSGGREKGSGCRVNNSVCSPSRW